MALKSFRLIIRMFILALCLLLVFSLFFQAGNILIDIDFVKCTPFILVGIGFSALYLIFLRKFLGFAETGIHEITHVVFAWLTLNRVKQIIVGRDQGSVEYHGKTNLLISLSPYCFPIIPVMLGILSLFLKSEFGIFFDHLINLFFIWHLLSVIRQFRFFEQDIVYNGIIFSSVFIFTANLINFIVFIYYIQGDISGLEDLIQSVYEFWGRIWEIIT
jgi:hypothetical protein